MILNIDKILYPLQHKEEYKGSTAPITNFTKNQATQTLEKKTHTQIYKVNGLIGMNAKIKTDKNFGDSIDIYITLENGEKYTGCVVRNTLYIFNIWKSTNNKVTSNGIPKNIINAIKIIAEEENVKTKIIKDDNPSIKKDMLTFN